MIGSTVRPAGVITERERYATALAGLWGGLAATLGRLETIAAEPDERLEDALATLPVLQYSLHRAGELAAGLEPPAGTEAAHRELASALAEARDVTGDVAELCEEEGCDAAATLAHEWRGALFRVRLARRRLAVSRPLPAIEAPRERPAHTAAAAASAGLVLAGTTAFTAGAVLGAWPLWAAGLLLVAVGFLLYRP